MTKLFLPKLFLLFAPAVLLSTFVAARETSVFIDTPGPYSERISVAEDGLLALELLDPYDRVRAGIIVVDGVAKQLDRDIQFDAEAKKLLPTLFAHADELVTTLGLVKPGGSHAVREAYVQRMECFRGELEQLKDEQSFAAISAAARRCAPSAVRPLTEFAQSLQALSDALGCAPDKKSGFCPIQ